MSNVKEYCLTHESIAYASCLGGFEIKRIAHGIYDYIWGVSGAWCSQKSYHCVRIMTTVKGREYIRIHGYRIYLDECIRMNAF